VSLGFIPPSGALGGPLLPADDSQVLRLRQLGTGGEYQSAAGRPTEAACLRCPDTPCATYSLSEREGDQTVPASVCPTDALRPTEAVMEITDACIGCGLCVLRCGFGAIRMTDSRADVVVADRDYAPVKPEVAGAGRNRILSTRKLAVRDSQEIISGIQTNLLKRRQPEFYKFVCSLLTALGLPARRSNAGDTSLRMDAVCPHPVHSVPVEIKSPTEVATADLKSVRQALENHVIMLARKTDPTTNVTASFAIGHELLSGRMDAHELADDIERTYGVIISIFSTRWLLARLVEQVQALKPVDTIGLRLGVVKE
jgi:ferredoxin